MSDSAKKSENYETYFSRINHKQAVIAGCIEELNGSEPIDAGLEEKLKQCVGKSFNIRDQVPQRLAEIFPDLVIAESKL